MVKELWSQNANITELTILHSVRSSEPYSALRNKCKNSFMYKHIQNEHNGNPDGIKFKWGISAKNVFLL